MRQLYLCLTFCLLSKACFAQATRAVPYDAQLRSDPVVGNIQGIQRYGRSMRTDPDEGDGYSYHVYPVAPPSSTIILPPVVPASYSSDGTQQAPAKPNQLPASVDQMPLTPSTGVSDSDKPAPKTASNALMQSLAANVQYGAMPGYPGYAPYGPYDRPPLFAGNNSFDATSGLRNYQDALMAPDALTNPMALRAALTAQAIGYDPSTATNILNLYHQPLIQIKLRVVEVIRNDSLNAKSVLEYVGRRNVANTTRTSGTPANGTFENSRAITNFMSDGLVTAAGAGSGSLINLTGEHINWAIQLLATEFSGDVVTAPEVVTLNGQNVEFVSGAKVPFQLGQSVITGNSNNVQQFFYKNVGTFVSVTPKIVNWGPHGEGDGEAAIASSEVDNWNELAKLLLQDKLFTLTAAEKELCEKYSRNGRLVPIEDRIAMMRKLNSYPRSALIGKPCVDQQGVPTMQGGMPGIFHILSPQCIERCSGCTWSPSDCTIDLAIVVRLSDAAVTKISAAVGGAIGDVDISKEENVRAVANVIQVKSGEGVVMAGLIGNKEEEAVSKVPLLGDIPYVGALFRSKSTNRIKTEVLVFLEAQVLDPEPAIARQQTAADFILAQPYLKESVLNNPLEIAFRRLGMGQYLPPVRHGEAIYWTRHCRDAQRIRTHFDDLIRD